jgi:DNA-binding HxlR family transcriptional regulator
MLRTRKQRADLCASCPIAKVVDIIGDPCSLLVLRDLLDGPRRFKHLDESLGMSTRTLSKTLRRLSNLKMVERKTALGDYQLTKKGAAIGRVFDEMRRYGKRHL